MKFLALLFLTGCSWNNFAYQFIDESATGYAQRFEERCSIKVNSSVKIVTLEPGLFGNCQNFGANSVLNVVYLNAEFWKTATDSQKELLVSHELGHCALNRRHLNTLTQLGIYVNAPASLMYSMPFGYESVFEQYKDYYYNELCGVHSY